MTTHAIKLSRSLRDAGLDHKQAEIIAESIAEAVEEGAATKADLIGLKAELKADIARLETKMNYTSSITLLMLATLLVKAFA